MDVTNVTQDELLMPREQAWPQIKRSGFMYISNILHATNWIKRIFICNSTCFVVNAQINFENQNNIFKLIYLKTLFVYM